MANKRRSTRSEACRPPSGEAAEWREETSLSPQRAFVVQFREKMDATPTRCCGRVEHIISGHATRFQSPEELLAFFMRILNTVHDEKEVRPRKAT